MVISRSNLDFLFCFGGREVIFRKESHFHQVDLIVYTYMFVVKMTQIKRQSIFQSCQLRNLGRNLNFISLGNLHFSRKVGYLIFYTGQDFSRQKSTCTFKLKLKETFPSSQLPFSHPYTARKTILSTQKRGTNNKIRRDGYFWLKDIKHFQLIGKCLHVINPMLPSLSQS